jgi:hypothetical protein
MSQTFVDMDVSITKVCLYTFVSRQKLRYLFLDGGTTIIGFFDSKEYVFFHCCLTKRYSSGEELLV